MKLALDEINQLYLQVQDYIDPSPDYLGQLTELERAKYLKMIDNASRTYNLALDKLKILAPHLSPEDIIEGYTQGCRLLQRSLSGYMGSHFSQAYVPVMFSAIRLVHVHTAWLFLQVLANQLGLKATPIILEALDSEAPGIREQALLITEKLGILESLPIIEKLKHDPVEEIALLAEQVFQNLANKTPTA